ncbi:50S ribosomal protein L2 [Candidatus Peregrinibacteria bacterium HGW-Peregrinibacteria-1]|jgi:large subunit ribosomal protein L2|nr:ribosomal protein L2 [uncultured bacterium]PKL36304.1 MAG: 50S ribosomal protein L2 [Candidatus Peregrinibacteria bacterium HGW-Peregrinibacteria-1]
MALKKFKPTTPGLRQMTVSSFEEITRTTPEKSLTIGIRKRAGRNNVGKITTRHRGGGSKRLYRIVDFKRTDKIGIEGTVKHIEYDPNRTAYIILVQYVDGEKRYHLAPEGIKVGDTIITNPKCEIKTGNRMLITSVPVGYSIYNVELHEGRGGQMGRTAGSSIKLVSLEGEYAQVQMPSGEIRLISKKCYATIGSVGNAEWTNVKIGKAGRMRNMGRRPQVRGKAMNPVDHPHGGGEGRTSIGLKYPKTPWGLPALGVKTRRRKSTNKMIVKDRRRK